MEIFFFFKETLSLGKLYGVGKGTLGGKKTKPKPKQIPGKSGLFMTNAMGVTWRGVRSESVKAEGFDMNHVRIVLFALCKVFCLYTSWEPSKELYHSTENFSGVAV